jgi:oxygen-independent coproporphyrinogen-3 oxidase
LLFNPSKIPVSLYIHIPWCIKKCPYCDFNSHAQKKPLPEKQYIHTLLDDLDQTLATHTPREQPLHSIFIGGGTPSLFSPEAIHCLLQEISKRLPFKPHLEITLEANPGTFEYAKFKGFQDAGINRLSIGVQSTWDHHLHSLGRIHNAAEVFTAIETAQKTGFNLNIDLMHGLPHQTLEESLVDLSRIIAYQPQHISWYQLTLEPHTYFAKHPPKLPQEPILLEIFTQGSALLKANGYTQYEISAFCQAIDCQSEHNLNYWRYGDYIGIGAGAHSKITSNTQIIRQSKTKGPTRYLNPEIPFIEGSEIISPATALLELMMNQLRVNEPFSLKQCIARTGISPEMLQEKLKLPLAERWITQQGDVLCPTVVGQKYLNTALLSFVPE